jgi:outer membrane biogenesis lipoprotein LolB
MTNEERMKKIITAIAITLLTACSSENVKDEMSSNADPAANAAMHISAAQAELKKVDAKGYAWRDTATMIKDAEKLVTEKKYDEAIKLADNAKDQAMLAMKQHDQYQGAAEKH